jgi:hypothetical protein
MSKLCRLCCKNRKLQGSKFFAKTQSGRQSLIRITSFALAKSPMSLTQGDEVPLVLTRKSRLQPAEFWRFHSPCQRHAFSKPNPRKPAFPRIDPAIVKHIFRRIARPDRSTEWYTGNVRITYRILKKIADARP